MLISRTLVERLNKINPKSLFWLIVPLSLSPLSFAHAYIDPGMGSYAIQIAIGAIFGATYTFKSFYGRLISRFKTRHNQSKEDIEKES